MAAILFFVLCGLGASVILAAASSTSGKMEQVPAADQKRFAVESAASFLRDELADAGNAITVTETYVEDSREPKAKDTVNFTKTGDKALTAMLESYVQALYEPMGNAVTGGDASDRDLSMKVNVSKGTRSEEVTSLATKVHFSMTSDYKITAVISDAVTDEAHPEDLCSRTLTIPANKKTETSVSVENHVEKDANGNITDEWTITTTIITTTISWQRGTIAIPPNQEKTDQQGSSQQ